MGSATKAKPKASGVKSSKRLVVKSALRVLDVNDLVIDAAYQREVKNKHKRIVAEFSDEAFGIPLVGEREDGALYIVDGLQRITAAKKLGKTKIRAEVFASRGTEHEATVFKQVNMNRTKLTTMEEYRAMLASHEKSAWEIKEAVESCGFKVGNTSGKLFPNGVQCIGALMKIYRTHGGSEVIKFALNVVKTAWPGDVMALRGPMLIGIAIYSANNKHTIDPEWLAEKLGRLPSKRIINDANRMIEDSLGGMNSTAPAVAAIIEKASRARQQTERAPKVPAAAK